jgi:hypothetical protein
MSENSITAELFSSRQSPQQPQQGDIASELFRSAPINQSGVYPPIEKPPVAISEPSMAASAGTAFMGGVPTDKQAAINYFAKQRGISPRRYTVIDGDIAYQADDGKFYREVVGAGAKAAYYAPDVLEMAPDIAAGVALAPIALVNPLLAAGGVGAVAAGSNLARQMLANLTAGQEIDPYQIGLAGLLSGTAELAPVARQAMVERRLAKDIAQVNPIAVSSLRAKAGKVGVALTPAELTDMASLMAQQKVIGNVPESTKKMQDFYKKREAQVQGAVDDYLNNLSTVSDRAQAGNEGLQALKNQEAALKQARSDAAAPIYTAAFEASVPVNTSPVLSNIDNMLKTQPPSGVAANYLKKIKTLLTRNDIPAVDNEGNRILDEAGNAVFKSGPEDRLPNLQNVKFEIDAMFKDPKGTFSSLDSTIQGKLAGIHDNLLEQMGKDNPDYIAANEKFAELSAPLNELNKRITGASLMKMSPDNIKNFANRIFENPSPDVIKYARKQITEGGGEDAWNAVTRAYLEEQWALAKKPSKSQQGAKFDTGNTWQNVIMGDPKQMKAMQAALPPAQFQALRDLSEVLEAAGRVKKLGSDTAFNQLITEELMKNPPATSITTGVARATGAALQPLQYGKMIADWATRKDASANAANIADIITSPDGISRLKELKKMSPTSAKRWAGMAQLLSGAGILAIEE